MKISLILFITLSFLLSSCVKKPSEIEPGFLGGIQLSLTNSTVSSSTNTLQNGESVTITLSLKDQFGNAYSPPNHSPVIIFSKSGGTSNGTFAPVTNLKNGTFKTTFTGTSSGTAITISPTIDGQILVGSMPSLIVTQGQSSNIEIVSGNLQTATVGTSLTSALVVNIQDANGTPVSGASVDWEVTGDAALANNSTTSNAIGLASNSLTLGTVTGSYTVTATIQGTSIQTTFTHTATPGAIHSLLLSGVPTITTAGSTFNFTVTAKDSFGNTKTDYTGAIQFSSSDPNSPTLPGDYTFLAEDLGAKQFSSTLKSSGNQTITVTQITGGAPSVTSSNIAVSEGSATQLVFITEPSNAQAGTSVGTLLVRALDAQGNTATSYAGTVTLAIASNPGGGSLAGTITGSAIAGAITFSGVSINKSAAGYTLSASGTGGVSSATTLPFNITSGAPASIAVSSGNNQSAVAGTSLGTPFVAVVQDSFGNAVSGASVNWVTTSGTLGNASTTSNSSGLASNTLTTFTTAGSITVTASIASTALSVNFTQNATHGDATQIVFTTQPTGGVSQGEALPNQPVIEIRDANNNKVTTGPDATANITLSLSSGSGALGGTLTQEAVGGVATFSGISIDTQGAGKVITATKASTFLSGGTTSKTVDSNSFTINPQAPGAFTISSALAGASSVVLSWGDSSNVTTYSVKYGTSSSNLGTTFSTNATTPATITGLTPGTTYYFMVTATNITGSTNASSEASATPMSSFTLSATPGSSQVELSWSASTGATSYTVKYGTSSGSYPTTFASGLTGTSSVVTGLTNGTPYYFMVTAQNSSGSLSASSEIVATPAQPTLSALSDVSAGISAIERSWDIPFTLGGLSSLTCAENVAALTSAPPFIANSDLTISGTYPNCNLNVRVIANAIGSAVITLKATYGSATAERTMNFTVTNIWTPASLGPTLALWLDAADASTITLNGSTVSQWRDKSGNNRHANQSTQTQQPTYTPNGIGGKPSLTFNSDRLVITGFSLPADFRSLFMIGHPTATGQFNYILDIESGRQIYNAAGQVQWISGGGFFPSPAPVTTTTEKIYSFVTGPTNLMIYESGTLRSSTVEPVSVAVGGEVSIGARFATGQNPYAGEMSELIFCSEAISDSDRQKLEGYLAWKWGTVSSLPSNHPYRWDGTLFGYGVLWNPASLGPTLALWLDAADASTITLNGSTVSEWRDKSENNRHMSQATAANQPTYTSNFANGFNALTFNGSSNFMSAGDTLDLRTSNLTIMSAVKYATTNTSGVVIGKSRYAAGAGRWVLYRAKSAGEMGTGTQFTTLLQPEAVPMGALQVADSSTSTKLFGGEFNRSTSGYLKIWENGTNTASTAYAGDSADLNNTDQLLIGAYQNNSGTTPPTIGSYLNGQIGEIVVATTTLSTSDRQKLEGYLAWKWGTVSSLPSNHPYRWDGTLFGYGVLWTPANLDPALALWLDADDANTITLNGSTVSQWRDKSSRALALAQSAATNQPAYVTNSMNARSVVSLDGNNDFMSVSVSPFFTQAARISLSVIRYRNTTTALQSIYATDITGTAPVMYLQADAGTIKAYNGSYISGGTYSANTIAMLGVEELSASGGLRLYRNGALAASGAAATAMTNNGFIIGRLGAGNFGTYAAVDVGEIVAADGNISTTDRQKLEGYLAWKWGTVSSLPSDHPYKNSAPTQ